MNEADKKEFEALAKPLIKFICEKGNPHMSIIINCTTAELVSGECSVVTEEFILD